MYTMSVFASRMARRLHMPCARGISGTSIPYNPPVDPRVIIDIYKEIHERAITQLQASYEKEISRLRQEIKTMRNEARKQPQQQDKQRLELWEVEDDEILICYSRADKIRLLHEVAGLRETVTAKGSLDIIVAIYRHRVKSTLGPPSRDPQSVLSALINGALDSPWHNYAYSRKMAISLVDPALQEDDVDKAGHSLYNSCCKRLPLSGYMKPIVLTKCQLSPPLLPRSFLSLIFVLKRIYKWNIG
ncbi:hypothetical protein IW262DRAFT_1296358 [Armillaria fumosa]|nr:hypothetical protein IW262DRAFT_1296358 [Armillaria fumosa]